MCFVWQFICWLASKFLLRLILLSWVFTLPTHQLWLCIFSLFPQFYTSFVISPFSACSTPPPSPSGRVCDCLSSFPSCLCPLSLSVALLPNWLCNPEWISVSCCAWLNQCVFVCVCVWLQAVGHPWLTPELLFWHSEANSCPLPPLLYMSIIPNIPPFFLTALVLTLWPFLL